MKKDYLIFYLLIFYLFFQISTIDYGTRINNLYENIESDDSSLITNQIINKEEIIKTDNEIEINKKNFFRFKLYSIEADEMLSVMALSKIAISKKIDPHYYQYGGSYLYPLGFYYFTLKKLNILKYNNYQELLKDNNKIDQIYFFGRLFILITFILSAYILYLTFNLITNKNLSIKLISLYLFVPSSIMFSQIIKPHWFSLIWINLIIYNLVKLKIKDSDFLKRLIYISIFMGLSIGSALYNIFFIIVAYIFIFFFLNKNYLKINNVFISLFFLTFSFIITNPIFLTNSSGVILEFSNLINWFKGSINFKNILSFYKNSLITGFGFANIIFLIYLIFLKKNHKYFNLFFLILIIPLILISIITSQQSEWHINFRYLPYFLPSLLVFLCFLNKTNKKSILNIVVFLTIVQMIPIKLAYFDENSDKYSTRLSAANWIEKNINYKDKICNNEKTLAPFNMPPINFDKFNFVNKDCDWLVVTVRNSLDYKKIQKEKITIEFKPRLLLNIPRTVFSHINPIIVIIKT
tara:strand:+ start:2584 stop:4149 length:1566 start_codon:yes stop_codon:yes gene_type:complete